ncbi:MULTISPECIES: hypothetical protein [Kitasatospora]|uniref:Uncharacterized protein n=1 Tax=Kitasatospora cathayae TaxID=3004092 RepID=A0ABY7PXP7_9ACTN|nr:hypothetical protein [Kitasatospora sp. HUAS 3-15]WBP84937.1 hypothetical protein O1G21_03115 [Kitasatospora sp. HUAS 3-15]
MTRLVRRAAVAVLATAAISALAIPTTASAKGDNHIQRRLSPQRR